MLPQLFQTALTLDGIVRSSIEVSVLAALILILQILLRQQLSPGWRYGLWALVLLRLLLPNPPASSMSIFNWCRIDYPTSVEEQIAIAAPVHAEQPGLWSTTNTTDVINRHSPPDAVWTEYLINCIWIAGVILLALKLLVQHFRMSAFIKTEPRVTDPGLNKLLEECKAALKVPMPMALISTTAVQSPVLFGFVRPRLLIPPDLLRNLDEHELRHIFLHEIAHVRRLDVAFSWVMTMVQVLHWFNPFLWYVFQQMRSDRELACDRLALRCLGETEKINYGDTILKLVSSIPCPNLLPSMTGLLEEKHLVKHRIQMIAGFTSERNLPLSGALSMALLLCLGLTNAQPRPTEAPLVTALASGASWGGFNRNFTFDGDHGFIVPNEKTGNFGTNDFTIEFWITTTQKRETQPVLSKRIGCDDGTFWQMEINPNGTLSAQVRQELNVNENNRTFNSSAIVADGKPHHVALIRNKTMLSFYIDGAMEDFVHAASAFPLGNRANLQLGASPCLTSPEYASLKGELSKVALHPYAMNETEIQDTFAKHRPTP